MKLSRQKTDEDLDLGEKKSNVNFKISQAQLFGLLGVLLGVLITVFTCFSLYQYKIVNVRHAQLEQLSKQQAVLIASRVETHIQSLEQKVEFFTTQGHLHTALKSQNTLATKKIEKTIQRQIAQALAVNILAVGEASLDDERFPPIRFSELQLLKQAASGEAVKPEAAKIGDQWLLHIIKPIRSEIKSTQIGASEDEDEALPNTVTLGVMWVALKVDSFLPILQKESAGLGLVRLQQNFGSGESVTVIQHGSGRLDVGYVAAVGDTHWELEFVASEALIEHTDLGLPVAYALMLLTGIVSISMLAFLGRTVGRKRDTQKRRKEMELQMHGSAQSLDGELSDPRYNPSNILDVKIESADEELLGLGDDEEDQTHRPIEDDIALDDEVFDMAGDDGSDARFPADLFRAYDIRGLVASGINKEFAHTLGQALGSEILASGENTLVVARDARTHSPQLAEWLIRGILNTGCNVLNIGTVPTPLMYFTVETMENMVNGVMVTASHNGADHNGFKIVMNGASRSGDDILALRQRMLRNDFAQGQGQEMHHDIVATYIDTIFSDVALAGEMNVVIDAGNGVAGKVAPQLFEELGCKVTPLFCDLDGTFPNHEPDPSVASNLTALIDKVKQEKADLGIALDGDGDRLTVVTPKGEIIWADRLLMLFAKDIISRNPGADVVFDVKSTRHLNAAIANYGGRPIIWKTGHSLMKQKMVETGALVGAEYSGHVFIKDRWFGFDDGMYAAARLLEILSLQGEDIDTAFDEFPISLSSPEYRVAVTNESKFSIVERLKTEGNFGDGQLTLVDGVRVDFAYGWGLVRASNTADELTLRFEANDETAMHKIKSLFVKELRIIDQSITLNWDQ